MIWFITQALNQARDKIDELGGNSNEIPSVPTQYIDGLDINGVPADEVDLGQQVDNVANFNRQVLLNSTSENEFKLSSIKSSMDGKASYDDVTFQMLLSIVLDIIGDQRKLYKERYDDNRPVACNIDAINTILNNYQMPPIALKTADFYFINKNGNVESSSKKPKDAVIVYSTSAEEDAALELAGKERTRIIQNEKIAKTKTKDPKVIDKITEKAAREIKEAEAKESDVISISDIIRELRDIDNIDPVIEDKGKKPGGVRGVLSGFMQGLKRKPNEMEDEEQGVEEGRKSPDFKRLRKKQRTKGGSPVEQAISLQKELHKLYLEQYGPENLSRLEGALTGQTESPSRPPSPTNLQLSGEEAQHSMIVGDSGRGLDDSDEDMPGPPANLAGASSYKSTFTGRSPYERKPS